MFKLKQNFPDSNYEKENSFEITIAAPANETIYPESQNSYWPEAIKNNPELIAQSVKRQELSKNLQILFSSSSENIKSEDIINIYQELQDFVESDEFNARVLLYLPFEMIPEPTNDDANEELAAEREKFRDFYLKKWQSLLSQHDNRSNFVDGDVPEMEIRRTQLPQVSKAAHLIPVLAEKGLISFDQVISLAENSKDSVLCDSIMDTIPVLFDLKLISENDLNKLTGSKLGLLRNVGIIMQNELKNISSSKKDFSETKKENLLTELLPQVREKLAIIEEQATTRQNTYPASRIKWERQQRMNKIINSYGAQLADAIAKHELSWGELQTLANNHIKDQTCSLISITTAKIALENLALENHGKAKSLALQLESLFKENNDTSNAAVRELTESTLSRLFSANIIDQNYLNRFDVPVTELGEKFSPENIIGSEEFQELTRAIKAIENDPELSQLLYPLSIVYGSKVKGYGAKEADLDLAFFVKPHASVNDQEKIHTSLGKILEHEKIKDTPLEFWLEDSFGNLKIKDNESEDKTLGNSKCTHVLFNGAWCGNKKDIQELYEKVMTPYLSRENSSDERNIWLSELERDTLQYRLMHKGYSRFHPEKGGINTKHSKEIDSDSAFWDSGYRQLATRLFVEKVFIPKL
ncbi:MAG: hypothetical protein ACOYMB_02620 [Patescibacteria group bacterium]